MDIRLPSAWLLSFLQYHYPNMKTLITTSAKYEKLFHSLSRPQGVSVVSAKSEFCLLPSHRYMINVRFAHNYFPKLTVFSFAGCFALHRKNCQKNSYKKQQFNEISLTIKSCFSKCQIISFESLVVTLVVTIIVTTYALSFRPGAVVYISSWRKFLMLR